MKTRYILLTSSVLLLAGSLSAAITISVNSMDKDDTDSDVASTNTVGVEPAKNWNNYIQNSNSANDLSLNDSDGNSSGATWNGIEYGNNFIEPTGTQEDEADLEMMNSGRRLDGGKTDLFTITGLSTDFTDNDYKVYLYFADESANGNDEISVSIDDGDNGTDNETQVFTATDYSGTYDKASGTSGSSGNYLEFMGLSESSFTVSAGGDDTKLGYFTGMQVVAVPEPSLFAWVLGAGALVWVGIRRRSRKA